MKDYLEIKKKLIEACLLFVKKQTNTVTDSIESNIKALSSETKSSMGDKHETVRAMLQLEMEKAGQRLIYINQIKEVMKKVVVENTTAIVCLGSLVITDKGNYYLAISLGKITIDSVDYYSVSTNAPIGQQLLGKTVDVRIPFNNAKILKIV